MEIFDVDLLFKQAVLALGAALVLGNGYAMYQDRRGRKPKGADGEMRKGRAWFLMAVGIIIGAWGLASLVS
ncbi:MAG: hypothetical protein V3R84_09395 [Acidimicrobiia bacterium]